MKKFFSKIQPYISFSKKGLFSAMVFVGILFTLYHERPVQAYYRDDSAAIGGAAGGGTGAAIGGVTGFGLGGAIGASRSRYRDPDYKLDRLYRKRDRLERKIQRTKSDKRRTRYQEDLDQVKYDIRKYEGPRHG
ncbi:hypothetical protein E3J61_00910 [Candidatus Dependentiae bacterium]|nr:MAG: hypothetical protein E3J61_00910 [Candidatus Dependentiae bacterium]